MLALWFAWCLSGPGFMVSQGWAQDLPTLESLDVTPHGFRASYDLTVFIREDGNLFVEDTFMLDDSVAAALELQAMQRGGAVRIVVSADPKTPYARVMEVLDLVQKAGLGRAALEINSALPADDPMFPSAGIPGGAKGADDPELINLDGDEYTSSFAEYKPKLHKFPQNPYGSTDFTAYTREFGEARVGLTSFTLGLLPRIHIGTSPALDLFGAYNFSAKGNFLRLGRYDASLAGSVFVVPINDLLRTLDSDGKYKIGGYKVNDDQLFVDQFTTVTFQLLNSLQIVGGWSIHGGVSYTRAGAKGKIDFRNLPVVVLPGVSPIGGDLTIVPEVIAELVDLRFATDYRFNRRDSLIFQWANPIWGSARGEFSADLQELPKQLQTLRNIDLAIRYSRFLQVSDAYRTSLSWQFSWQRADLRFGVGVSAISRAWWLQAFDLSYRFGGDTRRTQGAIFKRYRSDQKEQGILDDIEPAPPDEEPLDEEAQDASEDEPNPLEVIKFEPPVSPPPPEPTDEEQPE